MEKKYSIEQNIIRYEDMLQKVFSDFTFESDKWVLQKRIAWDMREIPLKELKYSDYEYKIRLANNLERMDNFSYYLLQFTKNSMTIDYEIFMGGPSDEEAIMSFDKHKAFVYPYNLLGHYVFISLKKPNHFSLNYYQIINLHISL